jgi:hypothetical protein
MRSVVIIVAALTLLAAVASGLVLVQKGSAPTATAASTVDIAAVTQDAPALPSYAPVNQIAEVTGSAASPLVLEANIDAQSDNPTTKVTQTPSPAAAAPNVKDQTLSSISKAIVHVTTRLKDNATGWAHKVQELELDLKLQLDLKKNQDIEATGRDIIEYLVVLRGAATWLSPDVETVVTLRKQELAIRNLAIRAEVNPDPDIRKTASYFHQRATELHALNRSVEETRTRLVTQIDRLEELKIQLEFNRTVTQISDVVKSGEISFDNIKAITLDAQRIAADLDGFGRASAIVTDLNDAVKPAEAAKPVEVVRSVEVARTVEVKKRMPATLMNGPRSRIR